MANLLHFDGCAIYYLCAYNDQNLHSNHRATVVVEQRLGSG